ncbi:hypothetical protein F8388_008423 [Cannabis sativa]|uniref:Disease resistance protein winged helix domain-containing protein n=1 Tax=Cannabis sativa TaxID=3483 RepID=A0A7J6DUJ8_CANSA|nr:hypothetical protein F8388_008423 [Cannabis sativa]
MWKLQIFAKHHQMFMSIICNHFHERKHEKSFAIRLFEMSLMGIVHVTWRSCLTKILSLSYNDLPYILKCCFLYVGYFPEDHSIRSGRLIQQWIPEGFVKSKRDKTLKGTTPKEYLIELINRNLIQVSKTTIIGKAKTFRIHDLLCDIILKNMVELDFCQIFAGMI